MSDSLVAARKYRGRGWRPIPIAHRTKRPPAEWAQRWTTLEFSIEDLPNAFGRDDVGVGVLLGTPSGGLVDVDLDCPIATRLAPRFLPPTEAVFGRPGKPQSHWLYYVPGAKTVKYAVPSAARGTVEKSMIVELRSTGTQTVFPPSIHESGEEIAWAGEGEPGRYVEAQLKRAVARLAAATLLVRAFPPLGSRDDTCLALVGALLEGGFEVSQAEAFIERVAAGAGCTDVPAKVEKVQRTRQRLDAGQPVTGLTKLRELMDATTVSTAAKWLELELPRRVLINTTCTDAGNGERFVGDHQADVRYCFPWKRWMRWDGRRWPHDQSGAMQILATHTARGIYSEAKEATGRSEQDDLSRWAIKSQQKDRLQAMLWAAQPHVAALPDAFDSDPFLLNVNNGTIDLQSGELREHDRADFITKLAPVAYDPAAPCPGWEAFLLEIMGGDADMVAFLQRAIGYTLTGDIGEQCLFLLHGTGANGKSTLIEAVRQVLGEYCRPTEFRTLIARPHSDAIRNDVAALCGLRMVCAVETNRGQRFDEALVKQLTGGDAITARFLYAEHFDFVPTFKIWLAVNHKPRIVGVDDGIWRRVRLIPFDVKIAPQRYVKNMAAKLIAEEGPGILTWMVRGCLAWQQQGLAAPPKVRQATSEYRRESDELGDFIGEQCVKGADLFVAAGALWAVYQRWCEDAGLEPIQKFCFASAMRERGFLPGSKWIRKQTRVYLGLAFKPEPKSAARA